MHVELDLVAHQLVGVIVESHVLDGLVVRSGGNELSVPRPARAVNGAAMVFRPLAEHGWRIHRRRLLAMSSMEPKLAHRKLKRRTVS